MQGVIYKLRSDLKVFFSRQSHVLNCSRTFVLSVTLDEYHQLSTWCLNWQQMCSISSLLREEAMKLFTLTKCKKTY